jgi:hypothetical protein
MKNVKTSAVCWICEDLAGRSNNEKKKKRKRKRKSAPVYKYVE